MSERLTRMITPPPSSEREALLLMGFDLAETPGGLVVTYPEGATRETINEREGRYVVFFTYHFETRQVTEVFNPFTGTYVLLLRPARFP